MTPTLPTAHPPTPRQHTDKAHARQRSTPPHGLSDVTHHANTGPAANSAYQITPDLTASRLAVSHPLVHELSAFA